MKQFFAIFLSLYTLVLYPQHSGTFKVVKQEKEQESKGRANHSGKYYIGIQSVFAGKSSPEMIRSANFMFGRMFLIHSHAPVSLGILIGHSHPKLEYQGTALGGFASFNYTMPIGRGVFSFPLEIGYQKLLNKLNSPNLDQYNIGIGLKFNPFYFFRNLNSFKKGVQLTFLGKYHYDKNTVDTFKGIYPTLRIHYVFY